MTIAISLILGRVTFGTSAGIYVQSSINSEGDKEHRLREVV